MITIADSGVLSENPRVGGSIPSLGAIKLATGRGVIRGSGWPLFFEVNDCARKGKIDCGILMLTAARSEKSSLGTSRDLAVAEVEQLYPTISMPVSIALFDLGVPVISDGEGEGGDENGVSFPENE